jgi:signal transduction histidine kinase
MRSRWLLALVIVGAGVFTLLVSVFGVINFAYRSPTLHVAVETASALISLLAAQLVYARFRRSLDRRDLLLTAALMLFAGANLFFSALPAITGGQPGSFDTWAPTVAGAIATALLAAAVFISPRAVRRPTVAARRVAAIGALVLAAIAAASVLAQDWLPRAIDPSLSPDGLSRPRIVGEPAVLVLQLVVMALFIAAAIGFARRNARTGDPLALWFAIGATLGAFARLNYFLFPSLYSDFFYTGDLLRLGFFAALLVGGTQEIRLAQRELAQAAVLDERRRLAREIHDGIAQDLAFIVQQARALTQRDVGDDVAEEIATAAGRALDESRGVIAALVRPTDEPLAEALTRVAEEAAGRWGGRVESSCADGLELSAPEREALMRIVGEAVTNAARHGHAQRIFLELSERPELLVRIADDGIGFDLAALEQLGGRHGLSGMRERAEQIGAQLSVRSRPQEGTEIVVILA